MQTLNGNITKCRVMASQLDKVVLQLATLNHVRKNQLMYPFGEEIGTHLQSDNCLIR